MEHIKITDLSAGNWVEYDREYYRVIQIDEESEHVLISGLSGVRDKHIDYIEPIHIKPEMLVKNGFEENGGRWYNSNWLMEFEQYKDGWDRTINCGEYSVYFIKHVHQLQNAMRLAGIDKEIEL